MHLDIQVGEHANNYPEIAAKDKLTELQLRARQLLDQVEQIQKEQDYQRVSTCHCTETWQLTFVLAGSLCIGHVLPGSSATETGVDSVRRAQFLEEQHIPLLGCCLGSLGQRFSRHLVPKSNSVQEGGVS